MWGRGPFWEPQQQGPCPGPACSGSLELSYFLPQSMSVGFFPAMLSPFQRLQTGILFHIGFLNFLN